VKSSVAQTKITVNSNGNGDHTTIQGALDQLNNSSLSNDVVIEIASGTYDEKLDLLRVSGDKKITITSQSGNAGDVVITNSSIANGFDYGFAIRVVNEVIIKNITFRGTANETHAFVSIGDSTGSISLDQVVFDQASNVSDAQYALSEFVDILNFNFGGTCNHLTLSGCTFDDVPIFLPNIYGFVINDVDVSECDIKNSRTTVWYGTDLTIEKSNFNNANFGVVQAKTFTIDGNNVYYDNSQDILIINRDNDTSGTGYITNNMMFHDGSSSTISIIANNNGLKIANNTFKINRDACILFNMDIDSVDVYNNIMYSEDDKAYGLQFFDSVTYEINTFNCDHNNYYFPNAKGVWYRNDGNLFVTEYLSVKDLQTNHSLETNGLNVDPIFVSSTDLHSSNAALKDAGKNLSYIVEDIDGEARKNKPDIGADEIQGNINLTVERIFNIQGTLEAGKNIQLDYEVKNAGTLGLNHVWNDKIYLSSDNQLDGNDIELKSLEIRLNLGANKSYKRQESIALPYVQGGDYYFIVKTNSGDDDFESSLTDNIKASTKQSFNAAKLSDLEVTSVVTPSSQFSGKSFELEWTVKNTGSSSTPGTWVDAIYVANDLAPLNNPNNLNSDSLLVVTRSAPRSLNPGESYSTKWSVNIPLRYSGKIYYRIQANANAAFFEVDTTYLNNGKNSAAVNITQSPLPDLIMTGLNTPNTSFSGEKVGINWTVRNQGQQKTFRTNRQIFERNWLNRANYNYWTDRVFLSRKPFYDEDEPSQRLIATYYRPDEELDINDSYTHFDSIRFDECDYGKYYIFGIANEDGYTYELTYSNNVGPLDSINIVIDPVPDLKPTKLEVTNEPSSGNTIAINYTILNDGFSTKPMLRSVDQFYISRLDTFNAKESIYLGNEIHSDSLPVNESYNRQHTFDIPHDVFGTYYVYCITDFTDNICEANFNDNNTLRSANRIEIDLSPQPDLVPTFISVPDTVVAGASYTVITQVKNEGDADADQSAWVDRLRIGETKMHTHFRNSPLAVDFAYNDTFSVTIPIDLTEGNHDLRYVADDRVDIVEFGFKANNLNIHELFVKRDLENVPDLEIDNLKVATAGTITAGDHIDIEYELTNLSKETRINAWDDQLVILDESGEQVYQQVIKHIGGLANQETKTVSKSFQLPYYLSGNYTIEYRVNYLPSFIEYVINNNVGEVAQGITAYIPPDLEITNISFDECCQKYALQSDAYEVEVTNNGPGDIANQSFAISVYLSQDKFGNGRSSMAYEAMMPSIAAGSSTVVSIPVKWDYAAEGDYFVIVRVDVRNEVYEAENENNNQYVTGYTINVDNEPITLKPTQLTVKSATSPFNDLIRIEYTADKGTTKALKRKIDDRMILSMDKTLSADDIQFGLTAPKLRDLDQSTSTYTDEILGSVPSYLQPGWYFVGVFIDGQNTVLEVDETNNVLFTKDSFFIDQTTPLTLDVGHDGSFYEGTINGREYFNLDRPAKKGMIVQLDFENEQVSSELYHRIAEVPTDAVHDNKYNDPFLADQEFLVPVTDTVTKDFLYLKANKVPWVNSDPADFRCFVRFASGGGSGASVIRSLSCDVPDTVGYTIIAKSAEYSIHSVSPDSSSYHGAISLLVQGFDFNDSTDFYLTNGGDTIVPMQKELINSTEYALHVDIRERPADQYDIVAVQKTGEVTRLNDRFTVFNGSPEEPFVNIHLNSASRVLVGQNAQLTIDFGNCGFADGHDYWLWVAFANESFDPSRLGTSYIGSSEEDIYDLLEEHPNPPNDSGYVDVDGLRYYLYWIPVLPARGQTTFTYNFRNTEEEYVLVQAELIPKALSEFTASQHIPSFNQSTSFYQLMTAAQEVDFNKQGKKGGFDCDNIDIQSVEKDLLKQTWAVGEKVHGGTKTFAGVKSLRGAFKKAAQTKLIDPAKDAVNPSKIKEEAVKAAKDKENLKKLINYEKPMTDRLKDYATSVFDAGNPVENLKKITKPDDPPFKDLLNNTFDCIDFGRVEKKFNDCTIETRVSEVEKQKLGVTADYKRRVKDKCREDFGLPVKNESVKDKIIRFVKSLDPNEIVGPEGVTDARIIKKEDVLQYTIHFENVSTAGAPARFVAINNPLPDGLRPQSFRLTSYGFGDTTIHVTPTNSLNQTIVLGKKYNNQNLNLVAGIDVISNMAFWRFTTIDPTTGNMVVSPFDGFLPPNDSTNIGQGFVTYEIRLESDVVNGTQIDNEADIIFDQNEVIPTNVWSNVVLNSEAQSEVNDLPTESETEFIVNWEGNAGISGSGIRTIKVYVSRDDQPYELWLSTEQSGSANFVGSPGATYSFYSVLTTLDGTSEYPPSEADATTTVKDTSSNVTPVLGRNNQLLAKVYPNPSAGHFFIDKKIESSMDIRVINMNGQTVATDHITQTDSYLLNLSDQPKGIYILSVTDGQNAHHVRLVVSD
jgi:hypothetical protein